MPKGKDAVDFAFIYGIGTEGEIDCGMGKLAIRDSKNRRALCTSRAHIYLPTSCTACVHSTLWTFSSVAQAPPNREAALELARE
eukprot:6194339-Pleurochrysis_carterae.AAC.2